MCGSNSAHFHPGLKQLSDHGRNYTAGTDSANDFGFSQGETLPRQISHLAP